MTDMKLLVSTPLFGFSILPLSDVEPKNIQPLAYRDSSLKPKRKQTKTLYTFFVHYEKEKKLPDTIEKTILRGTHFYYFAEKNLEKKYLQHFFYFTLKWFRIWLLLLMKAVLLIQDLYPGSKFLFRIPNPGPKRFRIPDPDPHQRIQIFNPKNCF